MLMQRTRSSAGGAPLAGGEPTGSAGMISPVAVVSGGSRGLGAALVTGLLERGYRVATFSRTKSAFVNDTARRRRREETFHWASLDGKDHTGLRDFGKVACERFGRLDLLVNNAGVAVEGVLPMMRPEDMAEAVDVNLTACLVLTQAASRAMLRQGSGCIVNISSVNAIRGHAGVAVYSATKYGLRGFAAALRQDLHGAGVGVSVVFPGVIRDAGMFADAKVDLPRGVGTSSPDEVANAVVAAIEKNRGEVDVAPLPVRLVSAVSGLAPELVAGMQRRLGAD